MLDVKNTFSNNHNHERKEALKSTVNSVYQKANAAKVIIRFLFLILTLNNIVFNGILYLQKLDVLREEYVSQITLSFS